MTDEKTCGDEPANCEYSFKNITDYVDKKESGKPFEYAPMQIGGFTKLERACIDLKVTDSGLDPKLNELILKSRTWDFAGQINSSLVPPLGIEEACKYEKVAVYSHGRSVAMLSELDGKE